MPHSCKRNWKKDRLKVDREEKAHVADEEKNQGGKREEENKRSANRGEEMPGRSENNN